MIRALLSLSSHQEALSATMMQHRAVDGAGNATPPSLPEPTTVKSARGLSDAFISSSWSVSDTSVHRCVMKMDHHCPWTGNCVGYRTLPHFIRFLFYSVIAMLYLGYFLVLRLLALWEQRQLSIVGQQQSCDCDPISNFLSSLQSLGPSQWALGHLVALCAINLIACFMISMLFCISVYCLGANMTAIEGLQIERHKKLLKRARRNGGCVNGPGGVRIRLERHEFPYDIGIYQNIAQGMGSYLVCLMISNHVLIYMADIARNSHGCGSGLLRPPHESKTQSTLRRMAF